MRTRHELGVFVKLPWRLYRDEPRWIAPLLMDVKKRLDQRFQARTGMGKVMDLFMWSLHVAGRDRVHPAIWQAADRARHRSSVPR